MTKYLVVDAEQHADSGFKWPYEIEAMSAEEACEEAIAKAFQDWGWEDEWHRRAPDWVVLETGETKSIEDPEKAQGQVHFFTSEMEYEPVFYVRKKPPEKP